MVAINKRRILLSLLVIVLSFVSLHFIAKDTYAANADFYDSSTGVVYKASEYRTDPVKFNALISGLDTRGSDFVYENRGKGFNYQQLLDLIIAKMDEGKDISTAFGECISDQTIQVPIPAILTITAVSAWNPILGFVTVTVNDSSLVKAAFDGTTVLSAPQIKDATHVTVFSDVAPTALALAGADGVKVLAPNSSTEDSFEVIAIE